MKRQKKLSVVLALLMIMILVLPACGNPADTTAPPPSTGESTGTDEGTGSAAPEPAGDSTPTASGSFTTSDYFDPPPSIHGNVWAPPGIGGMAEYVYDRLFDYVPYPEKEFIPMLGESFFEEGNKTTVTLKKGVVWSDGTPFTSKDVICTFNMGFMGGWPMWKYVDTIEAPDDYTVIINWKKPGPILSIMALNQNITAPHHIFGTWADQLAPLTAKRDQDGNIDEATEAEVQKIREDVYKFKPNVTEVVGTGPYKIANVTASEAILTKNENFREPANVKIAEVRIQRYVSAEAYLSMVMSNGYDGEPHGSTPDVFAQIEKNHPDMRIMWIPEYSQPSFQFNARIYPVDNPVVRKAISMAVDKDALLPIAEPGTQAPDTYASGLVPSARDVWMTKEELSQLTDYAYNPSKAEELLTSIGWKKGADGLWQDDKGQTPEIEVASMNSWPIFFLCGDALVNQLKEFGFKATFKAMELSAYWDYLNSGEAMISADFRAGAGGYGFPWEPYRNIYVDGQVRMGLKDPKITGNADVEIRMADGSIVKPIELIDELFYTVEEGRQREIIHTLMKATNEFCILLPIGEKTAPWKLYNTKLTGFPDDPRSPEWFGGAGMRPIAKLIKLGKFELQE